MRNVIVDQAILAFCKPQFRKVMLIVHQTAKALKVPRGRNIDFIGYRIKALVKDRKLEAAGNLDLWEFSEIRLPEIKSPQ